MNKVTLEEIVAKVEDIPGFSETILKVLKLTDEPNSTAQDVQNAIVQDQSLTVKVLRLANSAHYGFARRIDTISQATVLLGFQAIRGIVLAASCSPVLSQEIKGYGLEPGELWRHSQATAITARHLSKAMKKGNSEQAYTAALLHDIGKIILNHYMKDTYQLVLQKVKEENISFLDGEEAVLGFNHCQVGAKIGEKWNLPTDLIEAIEFHHSPEKGKNDLTSIVHIADAMVMMMGIGLGVDGLAYEFSNDAIERLKINDELLEETMAKLGDLFSDEESFLT